MEFNDETLMFLNACMSNEAELISDGLKNALINCFLVANYLEEKKQDKQNRKLVAFFCKIMKRITGSTANNALDIVPETIRDEVEPLFEFERKFEEILLTLGSESYREHQKHSKRNFWLGILLSKIKNNWGLRVQPKNFENSWFLISRFHDFCYILQNIKEIGKQTERTIQEGFKNINFSMTIDVSLGGRVLTKKYLELLKYINPGKSVSSLLTNISFLEQLESESHSILSALFIIDFMRAMNMVPSKFSEKELKKISRAIAIHTDSLTQAVLRPKQDYLAALMILVDEIQEWGRPGKVRTDPLTIDEIELKNLKVEFREMPNIKVLVDKILNGSGKHRLPRLNFEIEEQFENFLVAERKEDEHRIVLEVKINHRVEFSKELKMMQNEKKKQLMLAHARDRARTIISNFSTFAESIGLEAVELEPDDIISSSNENSINLEIPMLRKSKTFPINADENLLSVVLASILDRLSPFRLEKIPKIDFEESPDNLIVFNIPGLKRKYIPRKRRNLYRLNVFKWDWGIRIVADPADQYGEEQIFPVNVIEDSYDARNS